MRCLSRFALLVAGTAVVVPQLGAAAAPKGYAERPEVRAFIAEMASVDHYDRATLRSALTHARYQPKIIEAMQRPLLEPPKWFEYAPRFLAEARVAGGVAWWNANAAALARAEERYGVPPEVIVAIVGVESYYGRNTGTHRALDALATLAFDYPRRAPFFKGELREFFLLVREQRLPALEPRGSYAGALGVPQFMPGSYRAYAVDFDGDGRIDLWTSSADVVGSVANFLARHDWQRGQPVLLPAAIAEESLPALRRRLDGGISERRGLDAWAADGVAPAVAPWDFAAEPVGVLMLEERDADGAEDASYWIACQNFYVLTRYNRSRLYAAAVDALARAIKAAR